MKIREFLRLPEITWVNHEPEEDEDNQHCLHTAIVKCYTEQSSCDYGASEQARVCNLVRKYIGCNSISDWNDDQESVATVLDVADKLDI